MRLTLLSLVLSSLAFGQGSTVAISKGTPNQAITTFTYYDGSGNPIYLCKAQSAQPQYQWAVTALQNQGTLTSVVVASNVGTVTVGAHGFDNPRSVGSVVTISGSTTAALNGAYAIQSVTSGTVFTINTSGVANATYNNSTMVMSTNAPQTTLQQWTIERFTYNVSNSPIADQWAANISAGGGGSTAPNFICNNRAALAFQ